MTGYFQNGWKPHFFPVLFVSCSALLSLCLLFLVWFHHILACFACNSFRLRQKMQFVCMCLFFMRIHVPLPRVCVCVCVSDWRYMCVHVFFRWVWVCVLFHFKALLLQIWVSFVYSMYKHTHIYTHYTPSRLNCVSIRWLFLLIPLMYY